MYFNRTHKKLFYKRVYGGAFTRRELVKFITYNRRLGIYGIC